MKKDKRKYIVKNKNGQQEVVKEFNDYTKAYNFKVKLERKKPYMFFDISIVDDENKTISVIRLMDGV